jgi:ribA/ribD-fused uncharacterized protein
MVASNKLLYDEARINSRPWKPGRWREIAVHSDTEVRGFFGEYRFLSNFWPATIYMDKTFYRNVEIAYQAAKWKPEDRKPFLRLSEKESIVYNRENQPNGYSKNSWNQKKRFIMRNLVRQKFCTFQNPENAKLLLSTEDKYLEELNWWGDIYWGVFHRKGLPNIGKNRLGQILMATRDEINQPHMKLWLHID